MDLYCDKSTNHAAAHQGLQGCLSNVNPIGHRSGKYARCLQVRCLPLYAESCSGQSQPNRAFELSTLAIVRGKNADR